MIKTSYQTPELRDANDNVVQEGSFGKNTALTNSTNDGWIDYVMNDLEALHDTIGDSAPTLDGNGHVVEPANLAIGDEDGVRLKTGYLKTSGGTVSGTLNIAQNLKMQDNQENVFGGIYVPGSTSTQQYVQFYGGISAANTDVGSSLLLFPSGDGHFTLRARSADNSTVYDLIGNNNGTLTWRGQEIAIRNSPSFTGNPTALTQATNDNSTKLATTGYVVNDLKANAPLLANNFLTNLSASDDLNNVTTVGTYYWNGNPPANIPSGNTANYAKMFVFSTISGRVTQMIWNYNGFVHVRDCALNTFTWSDWKHLAYAEDVLPLTGGTLTGALTLRNTTGAIKNVILHNNTFGASIYAVRNDDITKGSTPTSNKASHFFQSLDSNGAFVGGIYFGTFDNNSSRVGLSVNWHSSLRTVYIESYDANNAYFSPNGDNQINLGKANGRWKQLFAGTTTISTSDERLKDNITDIPDEVLDAWGEVNWYQYQFKDSIAEKGETKARIHTGAIAQRIESVFSSHGLDANKYGLLCYDEWKYEPAERDEDGNIVQPARPAGNRYSLRYEEALCMEAAYQRRRADRLEQRLNAIEQRLSALETL